MMLEVENEINLFSGKVHSIFVDCFVYAFVCQMYSTYFATSCKLRFIEEERITTVE